MALAMDTTARDLAASRWPARMPSPHHVRGLGLTWPKASWFPQSDWRDRRAAVAL